MNKILTFILLFMSALVFAQTTKPTPSVEYFQRKYKYVKNRSFKGPSEKYSSPASMNSEDDEYPQSDASSSSNGGKIEYSPDEIERLREEKANKQQNGSQGSSSSGSSGPGSGSGGGNGKGGGARPNDPKMGRPKPIEFDPPDFDLPEFDAPSINPPSISATFWKWVLIILGSIALLFLIYYIVKNYKPGNRRVKPSGNIEDWNPELITKTELELRLEQAMLEGNYRECVRIYFTFILKEMIRLKRIRWKKDLTNFDYLLQASSKENFHLFEESVRIYDLVWYGDYQIDVNDYKSVERHLDAHYKLLNQTNA